METRFTQQEISFLLDILNRIIPQDELIEKQLSYRPLETDEDGCLYIDLNLTNPHISSSSEWFDDIPLYWLPQLKEMREKLKKMSEE